MRIFLAALVALLMAGTARAESMIGVPVQGTVQIPDYGPEIDALQDEIAALKARIAALEALVDGLDPSAGSWQALLDLIAGLEARVAALEAWAASAPEPDDGKPPVPPDGGPPPTAGLPPQPSGRTLMSAHGGVPDDGESDAGPFNACLAESMAQGKTCVVDKPGVYHVGNIQPTVLRRPNALFIVTGAVLDFTGASDGALFSIGANTDWRGAGRILNLPRSVLLVASPRDEDDNETGTDALEPVGPALRRDIDHFRLVGLSVENCRAVVNASAGGARYSRTNVTTSPDLADNPLIRELVIQGTMVRDCGGGYKLSLSRWGSRAAWEAGAFPWRITGNVVEDIDGSRCPRKAGYCGQAFEVGAHKRAFQAENGGLLFKGNLIRHVTDTRLANKRQSHEIQALRVQGGYGALITENHFEDVWFQCPADTNCGHGGTIESNDEGIYVKNKFTTIAGNTFVDMSYDQTEGGAVTAKSGGDPEGGPPRDDPDWKLWGAGSPNGEPTFITGNLVKWSGPGRTCSAGAAQDCNDPGRQIRGPGSGAVNDNVFGGFPESFEAVCTNCRGDWFVRLPSEHDTEATGNRAE